MILFSELLLTKFCHDITGPISAVHNGMEFLLTETQDIDDPASIEIRNQAIDLVQDSSIQSLARLQAFRLAYGVVRNNSETRVDEVQDIIKKFYQKSNVDVRWNKSVPEKISSITRRIVVGMILTLAKVVIYGGSISVSFANSGEKTKVTIRASATRIKEPVELTKAILNDGTEPTLENITYLFLKQIAQKDDVLLSIEQNVEGENKIVEFIAEFKADAPIEAR
jgi:histidine phosphotransferase ChpT